MIRKLFRQMMVTQIVSSMTVMLCMLIDSIMIGRFLGVDAMAAYGFSQPVLLAFAAPGAMISAGIQVVCGRTMGSGDREGTDTCFTVSAALTALIAAVGLVFVLLFAGPLSTLLGAGEPGPGNPVFYLTKDYLKGFILGVPAFLTAQIMVPYMQMSGSRTRLVTAVLLMTVSDVAFDFLNVFVFHGGTFGMGLASSLSYYVAVAVGLGYFLRRDCIFRLRRDGLRPAMLRELLINGVPTVINQLSLVLLVLLFNRILRAVGGNLAVAAYSVISTVSNLCYAFSTGISSVALMLSAIFCADEDRSSLCTLVKTMTRSALTVVTAVTALVLALARPMVGLFLADDPEALLLAAKGLRLFSLSLLPCALNTAFKFYYQGIGRVRLMEGISVLQNFALPALSGLLLSRALGTTGVWLAFLCGEAATLLLICLYVWRANGRVSLSAEDFALLPPSFGAAAEDCFECTVHNLDEAVQASERAVAFCRGQGQGETTSALIGMCIEEITCNIVRYGFSQDKKSHSIDVRLVIQDGTRLLRIRDNCARFDPTHYLELHRRDDPAAHMGIRMVMAAARDVSYLNTFGLNNLTLRV
ncbi:MAG: ATP-binding protein [Oscillospiraceae bacterium]|nr:ATP-binding protein [Oscillospiraceae bacterium]